MIRKEKRLLELMETEGIDSDIAEIEFMLELEELYSEELDPDVQEILYETVPEWKGCD